MSDVGTLPTPSPRGGVDRRAALRLGGIAMLGAAVAACGGGSSTSTAAAPAQSTEPERSDTQKLTAAQALARLQAGNARFVAGSPHHPDQASSRRAALAAGQHPLAQVLSCADSRVPPELVFDQGLGDLFITRSAGQVVDHAVLGTIQFGVAEFGIPLLVVLGHQKCGAVKATVEALEKHSAASGTDIDTLVAAIRPAVEKAEAANPADVLDAAIGNNVDNVISQLRAAPVLAAAIKAGKLQVVGAVYSLDSGAIAVR
jgi:carbonic anhydrase